MNSRLTAHTFHIPVMGLGYTIDTPIKVAHYGISSAISLVDDALMEAMREFYSKKFNLPFNPIGNHHIEDRVKRITAYLNLVEKIVKTKFEDVKASFAQKKGELAKYMDMLPDVSTLKIEYHKFIQSPDHLSGIREWLNNHLPVGSIDVNIMTKLDREKYKDGEKLPSTFNDAHMALKGFAESNLSSALILSAGMNPSLYTYIESFPDFFPDANGILRKRIILKVSDYRSALIQGKFLAKKGIWVSEFRVESAINCGGHAFVSNGDALGPILEEFKKSKESLKSEIYPMWCDALKAKNIDAPNEMPELLITAQGGLGTAKEHEFLLSYYGLDSIGWGSPFMLVPEATLVDDHTLDLLCKATEEDLYLSDVSPVGVPFNNLRNNTKDIERDQNIANGTPGFKCTMRFCEVTPAYDNKIWCTASRQYQKRRLEEIKTLNLNTTEYEEQYKSIIQKTCICVGLSTSALMVNNPTSKPYIGTVSVCPGPNLAYFTKTMSLQEMVDHIYGRTNVLERTDRPHMFIKELMLYNQYLSDKRLSVFLTDKERKGLDGMEKRVNEAIVYYQQLTDNNTLDNNFSTSLKAFKN